MPNSGVRSTLAISMISSSAVRGGGPGMYSGAAIQAGQRDATSQGLGYLNQQTQNFAPFAGQYLNGFDKQANLASQTASNRSNIATGAASAGAQTELWRGAQYQSPVMGAMQGGLAGLKLASGFI